MSNFALESDNDWKAQRAEVSYRRRTSCDTILAALF